MGRWNMSYFRKNRVIPGVLGIVVAFASTASADTRTGYLSLSGGADFPSGDVEATDIIDSAGAPFIDTNLQLDTGWDASIAAGLYVNQFRFEFQYTAQYNEINKVKFADGFEADANGALHCNLFMLNAYYDIPVADRLSIYLGAGAGALYMTTSGDTDIPQILHFDNQSGTSFAYQALLGLEYQVTPIVSIFGGYRGWSALDLDTENTTMKMPWFNMAEVGLRVSF